MKLHGAVEMRPADWDREVVVYESTLAEPRQVVATAAEIVVILAGRVMLSPGPPLVAGVGDLAILPSSASIRNGPGGQPSRSVHFQLPLPLAARLRDLLPVVPEVVRSERFGDAVSRMMIERRGTDACSSLGLEAAVLQVFVQAWRFRSPNDAASPRYSRAIAAAVDFAKENLERVMTLDDLARAAGMSLRGLSHRFAVELHTSPLAYVRELRLREAERLLRESSLGIAEIALRCGFYDHAHLTRTFRDHLGSTPADYRRTSRVHQNSPTIRARFSR